jgi:hypothetical protein
MTAMDGENKWLTGMLLLIQFLESLNHSGLKHASGATWWAQSWDLSPCPRSLKTAIRLATYLDEGALQFPDLPNHLVEDILQRFADCGLTPLPKLRKMIEVVSGYMPELIVAHQEILVGSNGVKYGTVSS